MSINFMGSGVRSSVYNALPISLTSGQPYTVPSGQWQVLLGPYTAIQWYDPASQVWRNLENTTQVPTVLLSSDGTNYRILNITGTVVGAVITTAGSGYTNGIYLAGTGTGTASSPTCTFTSGSGTVLATGNVIVGGAINTTVTITNGGTGYTKAPILQISAPPAGGVPATATATLTAGVITGVTVTNQGAGYTAAPTITVVNANGDTTGSGAILTVNATLSGSGTVTAITIANNGAGMTAVPTISFSPASTTAATAVMCLTMTSISGASGTGYTNAAVAPLIATSGITAGTPTLTNPEISTGVFVPRPAVGFATNTSSTAFTGTLTDGGLHQVASANVGLLSLGVALGTANFTLTTAFGGATDLVYLQPV
jgi:hypothetical protein